MEPSMIQESQVKEVQEVKQPEAVRADAPNPFVGNLEVAFKEAIEQIHHCDEQASLWLERKRQIQTKMNESLTHLQKQVNGSAEPEKKAPPRTRIDKNATVPDLIRTFLEKNGPARTKDIRKFLLSHGRKTNPGVSLSRMVKKGDLKNMERGVYKIA